MKKELKVAQKIRRRITFNETRKLGQESIDLLPVHIPNGSEPTNNAQKQNSRQDCAFNRRVISAAVLLRRIAVPVLIIVAPRVEIQESPDALGSRIGGLGQRLLLRFLGLSQRRTWLQEMETLRLEPQQGEAETGPLPRGGGGGGRGGEADARRSRRRCSG